MAADAPHALYRFYDDAGVLLYVGITADPGSRFKQHQGDKPWWTEVAHIRIEQLPTRAAVLAAERTAIRDERPLWNITPNEAVSAVRSPRGDVHDHYGRLIASSTPQWCDLAARHPQLVAVEQYVKDLGDQYINGYLWLKTINVDAYVCGHAFWYGVGNALDILGGPRMSNRALAEAAAGPTAGVPLVDAEEDVSQWPEHLFSGPYGFIHTLIGKGWNAPEELQEPDAGFAVSQRMHALMPNCIGPCICKPKPWS